MCSIFLQKEVVQFFKLDGANPPKSSFDYYCSEQTCETKNICLCLVVLVAGSRYRLEMHFHKKEYSNLVLGMELLSDLDVCMRRRSKEIMVPRPMTTFLRFGKKSGNLI